MPTSISTCHFIRLWVLLFSFTFVGCGGSGGTTSPPVTAPPITPPASDTTPNAFSFANVEQAALNTQVSSETITISGINAAANISISGGEFKINEGEFGSTSSTVSNNDKVTLRITSANDYDTSSSAILTIDAVSAKFEVTTVPASTLGIVVDVNLNIKHQVGSVERFQREKFITIHANHTENDWYAVGDNFLSDLVTDFAEGYDVYFGRDAGGIGWNLNNLPQDPANPGFVDAEAATELGNGVRWNYSSLETERAITQRNLEQRNHNLIVSGQQHPYWPDGKLIGENINSVDAWSFSQNDSDSEPFGSATGDYMGRYVSQFFNNGSTDIYGQPKPAYVEVMNEPLYDLYDAATNPVELRQVFDFHKTVANAIRNISIDGNLPNQNLKVGGYTAAFPDFDTDNFQEWEERDKLFIDIAGEDMDFISLHLYDMPRFNNTVQLRKGSNIEATFDMLEHYTNLTLGAPKPFVISEYGSQVHTMLNSPWTPERDWLFLTAINSQLMSFLERPNLVEMTIPFITVKAEWGRKSPTVPYSHRLMRQQKEAAGEEGELWVYTDLVKFYQLWSNVNGLRAESAATDLDIQVDAYVDDTKAYIIINSLEMDPTTFSLGVHGVDNNNVREVLIKHLYPENGISVLDEQTLDKVPSSMEIGAQATIILEITYLQTVNMDNSAIETKYYADTYKQAINANTANTFNINHVTSGGQGQAVLRLGIGRDHGRSLMPTVTFNGMALSVPEDFRGYDQYHNGNGRKNFFGVIEIPVPMAALQQDNQLQVSFDDAGGFISSVSLQVLDSTTKLQRSY